MITRTIKISHPDKVLFPDLGITKADLVRYYQRIAPVMLPYLKDRPVTMRRFPNGITKQGFYQQDIGEYFPTWIRYVRVKKVGGTVRHVVCNDTETLAYLASQACITVHVWLSRRDKLNYPDRLIFDLDPPRGDFRLMRFAATKIKEHFLKVGLVPFLMATGSRGLHVVSPLDRSADFDTVRSFARAVADLLAKRYPDKLTTEQRKAKRRGRMYLDTGRNAYGQTAVAPYSVRARKGAPVATPLSWDELSNFHPKRYTVKNIFKRLKNRGDPWRGIDRHARSVRNAQKRLARVKF